MLDYLRNRKKPILGVAAFCVIYAVCRLAGLDDTAAAGIAATGSAAVVSRSQPIFGTDVDGPKLNPKTDQVTVEVKGRTHAVAHAGAARR